MCENNKVPIEQAEDPMLINLTERGIAKEAAMPLVESDTVEDVFQGGEVVAEVETGM
ncbi:hypothetical protein LPH50_02645 [Xylella taiwanensis]|uniref:Uncharacterized protein n=1 Tax=Xylella taiwanensis TaxID=1444770 RepID=Z9JMA1_9GAMM|nr:hypothetical protein [Xylella taiwanensis]EWS79093.1 hypothetical protein AF72_02660 [Xylella taiwanensis]MCD8457139.1 hypothetical protein [Xylella taiwanensis]MCD8459547.1 hypothetical protein [Xylella taiwanensis]MCD8461585.1 hypothetical protein [Xylella taiwanensis]MCD8462389.1 hypothetical protein [Xylella taiwanensis]